MSLYRKKIESNNYEIIKTCIHSSKFWLSTNADGKQEFDILYKLALKLSSIPSTSASVERFFSKTGTVEKKKSGPNGVGYIYCSIRNTREYANSKKNNKCILLNSLFILFNVAIINTYCFF